MRTSTMCASVLLALIGSADAISGDVGTSDGAIPQRAPSSAKKQAYADKLIDALDRYEHEVAAHKADEPVSVWLAWATYGYRLRAAGGSSLTLLVLRKRGLSDAVFAIGMEVPKCIRSAPFARQIIFSVESMSMVFDGQCIEGVVAYVPHEAPERLRLKALIESRRSIIVSDGRLVSKFDLSGVPVLRAKLDAEDLVPPSAK
ncbi:hypothetical protein [Luteibacter jiangsuensis]